ncbi:histidine kinase [Polychaeton citri CBS 116435]|uniref:histidine kinase n=1 Tax=Polychaeton citri CBS 116435 TaxID=1314669 RepID=A0A9P4Q5N6_9PEZI|nr:histidine kinase [Polychaeton citri CBS 116435]
MKERETICFPLTGTKRVMQKGDSHFPAELQRLFPSTESDALEAVIHLKRKLVDLDNDDFWSQFTEGLSSLIGAEMIFVSKRMLVDDTEAAVEMPPIGEPGSCLMGTAFYWCDSTGKSHCLKGFKYHAYACPCAYMRHDKIFVIPEGLNSFITENPNVIPVDAEAYIGLPLFASGKCIAHFGALWSKDGAAKQKLSWSFIEMLLHAFEDMVLQRCLQGSNFLQATRPSSKEVQQVIPHDVITIAQSLRPYAGSLSHELRTPMQGVVGMLDVMYATVEECVETLKDQNVRNVFENLKANIEVVQDSSRRAVEAADNVVHAYDMDMSVPEGMAEIAQDHPIQQGIPTENKPHIVVAGSNLPIKRPRKRRLDDAFPQDNSRHNSDASGPNKAARLQCENCAPHPPPTLKPEPSQALQQGMHEAEHVSNGSAMVTIDPIQTTERSIPAATSNSPPWRAIAPGIRHTSLRDVLRYVIDEGLKLGGRPESVAARETDVGEIIEVRTRGSDGTLTIRTIEWIVESSVPDTMYIDEKDLGKLISCVFLNAIKFTDHDDGRIIVNARLSQHSSGSRYIVINISDNGPGIPKTFLPKMFKAFSQQNSSITRQSDGLGLGLMVAKGIARKLGGELVCSKAETQGPDHGSEFEITVPLMAGEIISRASSPFGSPMPRKILPSKPEMPHTPPHRPDDWTSAHKSLKEQHIPNLDLSAQKQFSSPPLSRAHLNRPPQSPPLRTIPFSASLPAFQIPQDHAPPPTRARKLSVPDIDRQLASKYPLNFLVAEDNKINRRLLVSMLNKFGYQKVHEAHDGAEAVRQMATPRSHHEQIDVILMDLWMPLMDGFQACEEILAMDAWHGNGYHAVNEPPVTPTVLAVTADVTDGAVERAAKAGMKGFMSKPYKMKDLQRLITEYCSSNRVEERISRQAIVAA